MMKWNLLMVGCVVLGWSGLARAEYRLQGKTRHGASYVVTNDNKVSIGLPSGNVVARNLNNGNVMLQDPQGKRIGCSPSQGKCANLDANLKPIPGTEFYPQRRRRY